MERRPSVTQKAICISLLFVAAVLQRPGHVMWRILEEMEKSRMNKYYILQSLHLLSNWAATDWASGKRQVDHSQRAFRAQWATEAEKR